MNTIAPIDFSVDSDLQQAMTRAADVFQSSFTELDLLKNAFNPIQNFMEVSNQVTNLLSSINWLNAFKPSIDLAVYQSSMSELMEVQKASMEKLSEVQKKILQDSLQEFKQTSSSTSAEQSPQKNLANMINASIDGYEKLQSDLGEQGAILNSINAAYLAWFQKTIQGLNG